MIHDDIDSSEKRVPPRPVVEPLRLEDLARLRLGWSSRFDHADLERFLTSAPGLSVWAPSSGEYLIGGPWRHRDEVAGIIELSAIASAVDLLEQFARIAQEADRQLVIASEHAESRNSRVYAAAGYEPIEEILVYELPRVRPAIMPMTTLSFDRVAIGDESSLAELIGLDHASFPWLWWNSRAEFQNYLESNGVEVYLGRDRDGNAVSYIGITRYRSWGHLDRIAVSPELQGTGFGLQSLDWAIYLLARSGARRIGLSTQARNERSRRLYERYGFVRVTTQDYILFGRWLGPVPAQ